MESKNMSSREKQSPVEPRINLDMHWRRIMCVYIYDMCVCACQNHTLFKNLMFKSLSFHLKLFDHVSKACYPATLALTSRIAFSFNIESEVLAGPSQFTLTHRNASCINPASQSASDQEMICSSQ